MKSHWFFMCTLIFFDNAKNQLCQIDQGNEVERLRLTHSLLLLCQLLCNQNIN